MELRRYTASQVTRMIVDIDDETVDSDIDVEVII